MGDMSHRFAAILAADVAHFSTLMEDDGEATVLALQECRGAFQRCVTAHHGREFGSVGDSLMAEFTSTVEALRAAHDIQSALAAMQPLNEQGDRLEVRIGLHAGDVISDGDNLFGDVVNIAARLQSMAKPGGITMSGFFHHQVRKESGFEFRPLGQHQLKNIAEPVNVYEVARQHRVLNWRRLRLAVLPYKAALAVVAGIIIASVLFVGYLERQKPGIGGVIEVPASSQTAFVDAKSIAVLPFKNSDASEGDEVFINGIHADILTQLAKLQGLNKVISQTSMEQYRDTTKSATQIAGELGVASILEGTMQRAGDRVRINAQLVDGVTDSHLWAETYELDLSAENLFAAQGNIARDVANAMDVTISADEETKLGALPTISLESHGEYIQGIAGLNQRTPQSLFRARKHFEKAIEFDPNNPLAYVGLADTLAVIPTYDDNVNYADVLDDRRVAIDKALELAPLSGEAHTSLAFLTLSKGQVDEAEEIIQKAIELSPNYATAYRMYSRIWFRRGDLDRGLMQSRKAMDLDPETPMLIRDVAKWLWDMGRVEESQVLIKEGLRKHPEFPLFYMEMGSQKAHTGHFGEGLVWSDAALRLSPNDGEIRLQKCYSLMQLAYADKADRCIENLAEPDEFRRLRLRISLNRVRGQDAQNRKLVEPYLERDDLSWSHKHLFGTYFLLYGFEDRALAIWRELRPEYCGDAEIDVEPRDLMFAFWTGSALYANGEKERGNYIFDRMLETMESMPRTRGISKGPWDYLIYDVRGETEKAAALAEEAEDEGFIDSAWWNLNTGTRTPAEQEKLEDMLEYVEQQRLWYEEHKDDPLF